MLGVQKLRCRTPTGAQKHRDDLETAILGLSATHLINPFKMGLTGSNSETFMEKYLDEHGK